MKISTIAFNTNKVEYNISHELGMIYAGQAHMFEFSI